MKKFKIKINKKEYEAGEGQTVLEVAKKNGIYIPSLCHHPDFKARANCRVCVVEVVGWRKLATACSTKVFDEMEVVTNSDRVKKSRNLNIELIFAEHIEKCPECIWRTNCKLLELADRFKLDIKRFPERKKNRKTYKFANAVEIDGSQCIDCRNCIDACSVLQDINYLKMKGKGVDQEIVPVDNKHIDCIYCGQCAVHCPVGAAQEQADWDKVLKQISKKNKIVVAQFAPSIRVSIGEEFGMPYGKIVTDQIIAGLKKIGFDYVFDVNFGADVTTMVEAEELVERFEEEKSAMPMITSCCPAWVKYVEFYHPELIPNLTTSRSPHIHLGGIIKTYWADKMNKKPSDIIVVSVMPCTAKKFEAGRKEMAIKGRMPVDYVITTRELAWMLKKKNIDFVNIKGKKADSPLGEYSGAAALYGGSGGVMESALRTAHHMICSKSKKKACRPVIEFKDVRGLEGVKSASVNIAGNDVKVAVVNGIGNFSVFAAALKDYHYVEVMACPGGCIGGGGQPIPTTNEVRKKRIAALYSLDKKKRMRKAHENKSVKAVLGALKKDAKLEHKILHTTYKKRTKSSGLPIKLL